MKPPADGTRAWTPAAIMRTSGAYWASFTLHCSVELGIFTALDDACLTAAELAEKLGCDLRGTKTLLTALTALELLEKSGESHTARPVARQYLSGKSKAYTETEIRDLLRGAGAKAVSRVTLALPQGCAIAAGEF